MLSKFPQKRRKYVFNVQKFYTTPSGGIQVLPMLFTKSVFLRVRYAVFGVSTIHANMFSTEERKSLLSATKNVRAELINSRFGETRLKTHNAAVKLIVDFAF